MGELVPGTLDDPRSRVRVAGLRALARVDRPAARRQAVAELRAGRIVWPATDVLREGGLSEEEIDALTGVALDRERSDGQRLRALGLLRSTGWRHLRVLLEARAAEPPGELRRRLDALAHGWPRIGITSRRRPEGADRARLHELLLGLDARVRRELAFYLN